MSDEDLPIENQQPEVGALCKRRGWQIDHTYVQRKSAARRRPVFESMLADAEAHKFAVLIVYRFRRTGASTRVQGEVGGPVSGVPVLLCTHRTRPGFGLMGDR